MEIKRHKHLNKTMLYFDTNGSKKQASVELLK